MQGPSFGPLDRLRAGSAALPFRGRTLVSSKSRRARERALRYFLLHGYVVMPDPWHALIWTTFP